MWESFCLFLMFWETKECSGEDGDVFCKTNDMFYKAKDMFCRAWYGAVGGGGGPQWAHAGAYLPRYSTS